MIPVTPTVHIVDDDQSFRTSVERLVALSGYRAAAYASGADLLKSLPISGPGCILIDVNMPELGGLELQERLLELAPQLPIVFVTGYGSIPNSVRAIKAGAEDFLEKSASTTELLAAIERGLLQYQQRSAEQTRTAGLKALVASLTLRESIVYSLIVRGKRNKQVAYEIGTTERTVKAHRHNIMEKLGARSLAEAVSIAERLGLLDDRALPPS
jgi:FixJ family two-component response regulator